MALLLASTVAVAEDKYPASDFQPKVVYQDETAAKQSESTSSAAAKPASTSSSSSDSQYPAANFEPKVVYNDENYKHNSSVPSSSSSSSSASNDVAASAAPAAVAQKEESSAGYLLGLVVFAIAGFVLFKRGAGATTGASKGTVSSVTRSAGGLTGVGRYILKASGTGVSRYLEKQAKSVPAASTSTTATGVAKYLASQVSSAKSNSTEAVTGVEKYMRNKG